MSVDLPAPCRRDGQNLPCVGCQVDAGQSFEVAEPLCDPRSFKDPAALRATGFVIASVLFRIGTSLASARTCRGCPW